MRRKQMNTAAANAAPVSDAPPSPASTGAMDTLLEKLRAAAPQTRDTRDRRRRARLKDRHQVRVASGQRIPETGENVDESGLLSPTSMEGGGSEDASSVDGDRGATSEGEDIADRAASMLQGLRGDGEGSDGPARDDSLRVRRRRESADDERAKRRARRRAAGTSTSTDLGSGSGAPGQRQSVIPEEGETVETTVDAPGSEDGERMGSRDGKLPTPTTVVVPPSPTASEKSVKD